ncbi:MAG: hypothetical protein ACRYE8_06030 [Janthinobacterium lividum]
MFKIARIAKQIFTAARNIHQEASVSINSMMKYCSQSKGYIEDARDEFTFESFKVILPQQSVTKDQFKSTAPIFQGTNKLGSYKILDSAETRKLIYARFADEIASNKPKKIVDTVTTYDITEEFKMFKEQGYDFAATREALQQRNQDTNQSSQSMRERMKELSISGFFSSYTGQPDFRENLKKVSIQKDLVINEFMATVSSPIEDPEEHSTELLG